MVFVVWKDPKQLRKITGHILSQIRSIEGYEYYDLENDRYPKVICNRHWVTLYELSKELSNSKSKFNLNLPKYIPPYKDIPLQATRANPTGFNEKHSCFLCEQNRVGRPRTRDINDTNVSRCPKCLQRTGIGLKHPCLTSPQKSVSEITNMVGQMDPKISDQVIYSLIKQKKRMKIKH